MALLSDVENALVATIAQTLGFGPNYVPGSVVSSPVTRSMVRIYRGWPKSNVLNGDLASGVSTVSIFPVAGATRRTTRYLPQWHTAPTPAATFDAAVSGHTVMFGGSTSPVGQVVGIILGDTVYAYRLQPGDTPISVAATLARTVPNATASEAALTINTNEPVIARIGVDTKATLETRRQEQHIWITIWSPTPHDRDVVSGAVDDGMANLQDEWGRLTYDLLLADGSIGQIRYFSSHTDDAPQQDNLWRRDLRYLVSYPTTLTQATPTIISTGGTVETGTASFIWGSLPPG
jgi:hypothetical protein